LIYIPLLKTRIEELKVAKEFAKYYSSNFIPLFEIITEKHETVYKIDSATKDFVYEAKGSRKRKVKEKPTDNDIITLNYINNLIDGKTAFIDYFRFSEEKYGKSLNYEGIDLAFRISRDSNLYLSKLSEVKAFDNFIPVISAKKGFIFTKNELEKIMKELKSQNQSIALRMTEEPLDDYKSLIENLMDEDDYLLFDIGEQSVDTKFMEFDELDNLNIRCKKILLSSPRKNNIENGKYEIEGPTNLIDNSALTKFGDYQFNGIGDYAGLKDDLPKRGGGATGAALALLFNYADNSFYAFTNRDTKLGPRGYLSLKPRIMAYKSYLDPNSTCLAYEKIAKLPGSGNWRNWNNITITRYLQQIYNSF